MWTIGRNGASSPIIGSIGLRVTPAQSGNLQMSSPSVGTISTSSFVDSGMVPNVAVGETVVFTASPAVGFRFANFTGLDNINTTQNPFSRTITLADFANNVLQANFVQGTIVSTAIPVFSVSPISVSAGSSVAVTGVLIRTDTNIGVAGQTLAIFSNNQQVASTTPTSAEGRFNASLVFTVPGTYVVNAVFGGT